MTKTKNKHQNRLTEKHMQNKTFRRTELAILEACLKMGGSASAKEIAKEAKIGRSTFYEHHQAANRIVLDYEQYLMRRYEMNINRLIRKEVNLEALFSKMLLFISMNKRTITSCLRSGRKEILVKFVRKLHRKVVSAVHLPKNSRRILKIYTSEIVELLVEWIREKCPRASEAKLLDGMMYLTRTMRSRLAPFLD